MSCVTRAFPYGVHFKRALKFWRGTGPGKFLERVGVDGGEAATGGHWASRTFYGALGHWRCRSRSASRAFTIPDSSLT